MNYLGTIDRGFTVLETESLVKQIKNKATTNISFSKRILLCELVTNQDRRVSSNKFSAILKHISFPLMKTALTMSCYDSRSNKTCSSVWSDCGGATTPGAEQAVLCRRDPSAIASIRCLP
jgi:hypothetical protein